LREGDCGPGMHEGFVTKAELGERHGQIEEATEPPSAAADATAAGAVALVFLQRFATAIMATASAAGVSHARRRGFTPLNLDKHQSRGVPIASDQVGSRRSPQSRSERRGRWRASTYVFQQ